MSIASRLVNLHPQTLRRYEEMGLIKPIRVSGRRLYSERDIERLRTINYLTDQRGVNLAGVEIILEIREQMSRLQQDMVQMQAQFEQEIARLRVQAQRQQHSRGDGQRI